MDKPTPLVSIVTPFLNEEDFIVDAIQSVLKQTFSSWELILVDDGSTDNSTLIARSFAARHPHKIFYLQHPNHSNRGMSASRLLGISFSRGLYIANLDADDVFMPDKLEKQVSILNNNPDVAMTFSPMLIWRSWSGDSDEYQRFQFPVPLHMQPPRYIKYLLNRHNDPHGFLVRSDFIKHLEFYNKNIHFCEDWVFCIKLMLQYSVYIDDRPDYCYRIHPGQGCAKLASKGAFYSSFLKFYHWLIPFLIFSRPAIPLLFSVVIREYIIILWLIPYHWIKLFLRQRHHHK